MTGMVEPFNPETGVRLTPEQVKRRRQRNWAIALTLAGLVVMFYLITIVKLGPAVLNRPL
jgi:hypothetical protein